MSIGKYLNHSIQRVAATVLQASAKSFKEMRFVTSLIPVLQKKEKQREALENTGIHVPPFLIASIASKCNLHCMGCYARASGACGDVTSQNEMTADEWQHVFTQAGEAGISFILLAGGEPLMRRDVIDTAVCHTDIVFPIFTNGTLIDHDYFAVFNENRHLIPIISIEGTAETTDIRRGEGVSEKLEHIMDAFKNKGMLYGVSITVTSRNIKLVTSEKFIAGLRKKGCGIVFFVEYVPAEPGSDWLVLDEVKRQEQEKSIQMLKRNFKNMVLIAFPGDEKFMGGCLAAGRGFFHINSTGGAEPCPFSPFSDMNVKTHSLLDVLSSPLFKMLRESELMALPHTGGCALFHQEKLIKTFAEQSQNHIKLQ